MFKRSPTRARDTNSPDGLGTIATSGPVTVTDNLPVGLVATALSGNGWTCSLTTLSCTRSDALLPSHSYPAITVMVNVAANAPASLSNSATVSGGGSISATATATDVTITQSLSNLALAPIAINFGNQAVGVSSATQTVILTNIGTSALSVTNVAASGDFSQTNNCATVAASGSCIITVTFTPTVSGSRTGVITIADNGSNSPQVVRLSGVGISGSAPTVSLSSIDLDFGSQAIDTTSAAKTVTLTNSGGTTLTVSSVTATGNFAQTNNCAVWQSPLPARSM